ncbi:hypothetical protein ROZALSC1DRAFT_25016, partial [Rozella allomycis CSF55]
DKDFGSLHERLAVFVLFNDREISPEGYVSTILAQFKSNLTSVASQFSKSSIRKLIRDRLEKSLIEIIAQNYCFNPSIKALDKESASDPYWIRQVQIGSSSLVKSEIVKNCTMDLVNEMESQFSSLVNKEPLVHHSSTLSQMVQLVQKKLRNKLYITIEQIENALKPLKCDLEFTPNDWSVARSRVLFLLEKKLKQTELILEEIHSRYDKRTLLNAVEYLKKQRLGELKKDDYMDPSLIKKGNEAAILNKKINIIKYRLDKLREFFLN